MSLDHSKTTATLSVAGLALSCYNHDASNWEVGFIRAPSHRLDITVTKQSPAGTSSTFTFQIDDQHKIFIEAQNVDPPDDPLHKPMATFDRLQTSGLDLEDLRWVVDFEKDLNDGQAVTLKKPEVPIIPMFVSNPLLYADPRLFVFNPQANLVLGVEREVVRSFPKFSEGARADITCEDDGEVVLRVEGPLGFELHLPHIPDAPHKIVMDNTCPADPLSASEPSSDFKLYYSVIEATEAQKFDIDVPQDHHGQGAVCNTGFLGSRKKLFPLPE